jgi:hypothetical protein
MFCGSNEYRLFDKRYGTRGGVVKAPAANDYSQKLVDIIKLAVVIL